MIGVPYGVGAYALFFATFVHAAGILGNKPAFPKAVDSGWSGQRRC